MILRLPVLLCFTALAFGSGANAVSVSSWEELKAAIARQEATITLTQDIEIGSEYLDLGYAAVIEGNGHFFKVSKSEGSQNTVIPFSIQSNGSLTWNGVSVSGTVDCAAGASGSLLELNERTGNLTVDHGSFSGIQSGNAVNKPLIYVGGSKSFNLTNSDFSSNGMTAVETSASARNVNIDTCKFTGNGSEGFGNGGALDVTRATVANSTFTTNHAKANGVSVGDGGGAIHALGGLIVEDCDFTGNYVTNCKQGNDSFNTGGGAISIARMDSKQAVSLSILTKNKNSVFEGNYMEIAESDGSTRKMANSVYVNLSDAAASNQFSVNASKDTSIIFYDPIIVDRPGDPKTWAWDASSAGEIKFNENRDVSKAEGQGRIVFSGEKYTDDADRMSRIQDGSTIHQYAGEVVITKNAVLGADMASMTTKDAKATAQISHSNYGYYLSRGTLTMTEGGSLIAGGFMVGGEDFFLGNDGQPVFGGDMSQWCVLSVGSGANLTTGWVKMDQGVSFDLESFFKTGDTGLHIDLTAEGSYHVLDSDFIPSDNGRFVLGGTLGLADSLNMYKDAMWKTQQEFLLMELGASAAEEYGGKSGFDSIVSNTAKGSKVEDASVYNGEWKQEWRDSDGDGKVDKLYAVWVAEGNTPSIPEPSSAFLGLMGLGVFMVKRRR